MALKTPIGHGPIDTRVRFNESPPVYYRHKLEVDKSFSRDSGIYEGDQISIPGKHFQVLPEQGGLYGIALRPRQEHYHNFIYPYSRRSTVFEDNEKVVHSLKNAGRWELLKFFGWEVIHGWYKETVSYTDSSGSSVTGEVHPLVHGVNYTESASGSTSTLNDLEKARQKAAKWSYKLIPVPIHSFGQTGSTLKLTDDKVAKLAPFQSQLQSNHNGPTGIGVHWGLRKRTKIPYGMGFYLDFYINKDIDPLTNDDSIIFSSTSASGTTSRRYVSPPFHWSAFQRAFTSSGGPPAIENDDVFVGDRSDDQNSSFYFINKSYLVIQIIGDRFKGNCFFLVITSDANAKLFQAIDDSPTGSPAMTRGRVKLLSEYNPSASDGTAVASGLNMLRGNNGHLRLQIRQIMNHIIIENNVFETPWVISMPVYKPRPVSGRGATLSTPSRTSGTVTVNQLGGTVNVFGGNLSTAVSFGHLNYYDSSYVDLKELEVWGRGRSFYTLLNSFDAEQMDPSLVTSSRYFPNGAQLIKHGGGITYDVSSRPDQYFGGFGGSVNRKSELRVVDNKSNVGSSTSLQTRIHLTAGRAQWSDGTNTFKLGACITPVLQFCRQIAPRVTRSISTSTTDIEDLVETIEITKEAEDYHAVSVTGSMLVNVLLPGINISARRAVLDSIGKARYLSIDASHFGCAAGQLQTHRTGTPPGGSVSKGSGGDRTLFTGIACNPSVMTEAGKRYVKYELKDFWVILESKLIINSPYFDGAIDTDVIKYLLDYTGFKSKSGVHGGSSDAFPISFSFNKPLAKFQDRKPVADAIKETARKYTKYAFFNNNGVFCYKRFPHMLLGGAPSARDIKFSFFSSHIGSNANVKPFGNYYDAGGGPGTLSHNSQMAYQVKTTQWNNTGVFNKLMLLSVDARTRGYIIISDANFDSLTDPSSLGFLGYERTFIQDEAAFGSYDRARKILRYYTRMYRPIYNITWKTLGGNLGVDVFDMVRVDGAYVIVTKISHSIDAKNNSWETEYTGEWIYPPLSTGEARIIS